MQNRPSSIFQSKPIAKLVERYTFLHIILGLLVGGSQLLAVTHLAHVLQIGQFSKKRLSFLTTQFLF